MRGLRWAIFSSLLCLGAACQPGTVLVVSAGPVPERADAMEALLTVEGVTAPPIPIPISSALAPGQPYSFALRLPADVGGPVSISVAAMDRERCLLATGDGRTLIHTEDHQVGTTLDISLEELRAPACANDRPLLLRAEPGWVDTGAHDVDLWGWGLPADVSVLLDGRRAAATWISHRQIRISLPAQPRAAGAVNIQVENPDGARSPPRRDLLARFYRLFHFREDRYVIDGFRNPTSKVDAVLLDRYDADSDGRVDILARDGVNLFLAENRGGASLIVRPLHHAAERLDNLRLADADGDGRTDVLLIETAAGADPAATLLALPYRGLGVPSPLRLHADLQGLVSATIGEFDGDGRPDLFVVRGVDKKVIEGGRSVWLYQVRGVSVLPSLGGLRYGAAQPIFEPSQSEAYQTLLDADGDGLIDLITSRGTRRNERGRLSATLSPPPPASQPRPGCAAVRPIEDLDGDGGADLLLIGEADTCRPTGRGEFRVSEAYLKYFTPEICDGPMLIPTDLDGDLRIDLVCSTSMFPGTLLVLLGRDGDSFELRRVASFSMIQGAWEGDVRAFHVLDLDRDGRRDLVRATYTGFTVLWNESE